MIGALLSEAITAVVPLPKVKAAQLVGIKKKLGKAGVKSAYEAAKAGGKHAGFLPKYRGMSRRALEKSIRSHQKQIDKHLEKVANPSKYWAEWNTFDASRQQRVIKNWQQEITSFSEHIEIAQDILKERQ